MKKDDEQADGTGGIAAVVLCSLGLIAIIFIPARQGASPGSKFYLAGLALMGIGWGAAQIQAARRQAKRDAKKKKAEHDKDDV